MNIFLRVDASYYIGSGHVMRCLVLARACREKGAEVTFVCRELPGNLISLIEQDAFSVVVLSFDDTAYVRQKDQTEYAFWLAVSQEQDAMETLAGIAYCDWMIVDHYGLDVQWQKTLRAKARKIMVIDDLANRQHDANLLLDQNYFVHAKQRYVNWLPNYTKYLLGPDYALLNVRWRQVREKRRAAGKWQASQGVQRILLFMGGADAINATATLLHAFPDRSVWSGKVDVVIGKINKHSDEILKLCDGDARFCSHTAPPYYMDLMAQADFAIAAAGSSAWERCCIGLPALMFVVADNQIAIATELSALAVQEYGGDLRQLTMETCRDILRRALVGPGNHTQQIAQGVTLCDGLGAKRVVEVLYEN